MSAARSIGRASLATVRAAGLPGVVLIASAFILPASLPLAAWLGARMGDASCVAFGEVVPCWTPCGFEHPHDPPLLNERAVPIPDDVPPAIYDPTMIKHSKLSARPKVQP